MDDREKEIAIGKGINYKKNFKNEREKEIKCPRP